MNLFLALTGISMIIMVCSTLFIGTISEDKVFNAGNLMGTGFVILAVAALSLYV